MAPSGGPLKTAGLHGKSRRVRGVRALWGQQWSRLPFGWLSGEKYCPNGGMTLPTSSVA
jgi:hypothetical protein